jgi:bifunctional UDP-N-acetylglucosamine pyrophosphorylase/glucosamine-1-phosphate N-acetyltransferase
MILAAGLGTRMKSSRAKVLHEVAGLPLIVHVIRAALGLQPNTIFVVVGHQAEEVERASRRGLDEFTERKGIEKPELRFVRQTEQLGTGHAVMAAREELHERSASLVVLAGDGPMIKPATLARLVLEHTEAKNSATLLTVEMADPTGYGRIVRSGEGQFAKIVEQKDASPAERAIHEVCVSIYCFAPPALLCALQDLKTDNAQREYYLTDVPGIMLRQGKRVGVFCHTDSGEVAGINNRIELSEVDRKLRAAKARELMLGGVTMIDPDSVYIHQDVEVGADTVIYPQVIIEGPSRIGANCTIQSWTRLRNTVVEDGVTIRNSSVIEDCLIRAGASVGPFSRLRMGAEIGEKAAIGNFVELKKTRIGRGSKAQHLTYLGDATLGDDVNIGAGTVTCNYDGVNKHETVIEDGVRIGSDTMLVAPVRVGRGSKTGAGSVVTKDVPPDTLVAGVPALIKKSLS